MRNPSVESLSVLELHAYAAWRRLAGVEFDRGQECCGVSQFGVVAASLPRHVVA